MAIIAFGPSFLGPPSPLVTPRANIRDHRAIPDSLPQITLTHEFFSSYAFTTFAVNFLIINGDDARTNIGCISAPVTPDLGSIAWMLTFLPFAALVCVGIATLLAAVYSPWGTTDIFMWSSNHGRDVDLLRLVTPGFGDCLQYIQFAALTGGLSLSYPGFYQPVTSQVSWSTLMFNQSFVSNHTGRESLIDGIYVTNSTLGLGRYSQLVGLGEVEDVWPGMMVWLLVVIGSILVLTQLAFVVRWVYRYIRSIPEEDLRSKNVPLSLGNVVRIALHFFLLPLTTLSIFQLAVAGDSPAYSVALAVVTLVAILAFAVWLLRIITRAQPRAELFDDLSTVLTYGPLYNTYTDEAAGFALMPIVLAIMRGIAIGGLQISGVAQIAILATAEIVQLLTLIYFRPFHYETSMNAYHSLFSILRLVTVLLMIAFAPSLGVTEGPKGWIGYVILAIHGIVIVFGFLLNAIQTLVEVVARLLGAGGDDAKGLTRGGLSKIFGMRQLSRRMTRRHHGPFRHSQLSTSAMLDADQHSKQGYIMPSGHVRSGSNASIGGLMNAKHQRSSSAVDSLDIYPVAPGSSFTPTTPGDTSQFSFLGSPTSANRPPRAVTADASDPYYRPPRKRQGTMGESIASQDNRVSVAESSHLSQSGGPLGDPSDLAAGLQRGATPALHGAVPINLAPRTDYSTREVDFYYGVRGPALNSDRPGRRLGTGPADPTGPVATAQGWFMGLFGGKSKEKNKGFEVVRSARMPPAMQAQGRFRDDPEAEGTPVAMSNLRNGPVESDDEESTPTGKRRGPPKSPSLLDERGEPRNLDVDTDADLDAPIIPRKSSKRHSGVELSRTPSFNLVPPSSPPRSNKPPSLPFDRSGSLTHQSSLSSLDIDDMSQMDMHRIGTSVERPTSGVVPQHSTIRVEPDTQVDLLGSSAEVLDAQYASSQTSGDGKRTPTRGSSQRSRGLSSPGSRRS